MSEEINRKVKKPFERQRVKSYTKGKSLTQQSFAKKANINNVMKQYEKTGLVPQVTVKPVYEDTPVGDYHAAMNLILHAQNTFDALPATLRGEFKNDAGVFLDFVNNPDNLDKMIEMGLAQAPPVIHTEDGVAVDSSNSEGGTSSPEAENTTV